MTINKNKKILSNIELLFLGIYFFTLPIAHITSIQSISSVLFICFFLFKNYNNIDYRIFFEYKWLIISMIITLVLAFISLGFTPEINNSLKEIKSELIRNFALMIILFYYTLLTDEVKLKKLISIIFCVLLIHTIINLVIWIEHGGFPYRAGGLLDSGGGERFGIWATYSLAASIALFYTNYKKSTLFILFLSVLSICANQTRATFVATIVIAIIFFIFFAHNKKIKLLILSVIIISIGIYYQYSENLTKRYNIKHMISNVEHIIDTSPSKFTQIDIEHSSLVRLSMWKSVILYRLKKPFIPTGYGRFLYKKSIEKKFENSPENLPYKIFAQTHNDFIGTLYSLGMIGLLALIYLLYYKLKISYSLFKISNTLHFKVYAVFIFLGTIGFIGSMMFGSFFGDSETKFFYPLYGILLGIYYNEKKKYCKII